MKGDFYFEEHPWDRACTMIRERGLGKVFEIAIQAVCANGQGNEVLKKWLERSEALSRACFKGELLKTDRVVSFVGRNEECILRIFIDESEGEGTENFEIVTENALVVWKPGSTLQGRITNGYVGTQQKFVCELEEKQ